MPNTKLDAFIIPAAIIAAVIGALSLIAQPPAVYDAYPLTIEENDFLPANAGQTTFQTLAQTKGKFVIVFRNGVLQRPCNGSGAPCDYLKTGNIIVTYPAGIIQAGDQVTVFYFR